MPDVARIPVILNPSARSSRARGRVDDLRSLSGRVELHETRAPGDARRFAHSLALAGAPVVVAAGGDGTVNEVVNGLAMAGPDCPSALGLMPSGTMNVFAKGIGLPVARVDECWHLIERGWTKAVDLWTANGTYFVQLAGAGLDAAVIQQTTWESKKRLGPLSYAVNLVRLMRQGSPRLTVSVPDRPDESGALVLVGNGQRYGGPFRLFPQASYFDGLLDVLILRDHGWSAVMRLSLASCLGRHRNNRSLTYFQAAELRVAADQPVPAQVDGELCGSTPLHLCKAAFPMRVVM